MKNEMIAAQPNERSDILRELRYCLTDKKDVSQLNLVTSMPVQEPIQDLLITFNGQFRKAGGKYIPCTVQNLVKTLIQICMSQHLGSLLNTSPNLSKYLDKYQVPYISALRSNEPVDVALFFSDMLVARTGAIGFTQEVALYPSVKNLARNLIVVSRECCIFSDMSDALQYQKNRDKDVPNGTVEFIVPRQPEPDELGTLDFTPMNPRIILLMVEEQISQSQTAENQTQNPK